MVDALTPPVRRLGPGDADYPRRLLHLADPPEALYLRGDLSGLQRPTVAIVGSRRGTPYGRRVAEALAIAAAGAGWTVLSGLALGVDGAAHQGALDATGVTGAVLGSGPHQAYPRAHRGLMRRILASAGGFVLSEHPPGIPARAFHFPRRNRILAALAHRVVVVEAATRSGALITARVAAELGRDVWAVPGSIFSPVSEGTHALLEDGAIPVANVTTWRASLLPESPGERGTETQGELGPEADALARDLWAAVHDEPHSLDELCASLDQPPRDLLARLTSLEVEGWVERDPGGRFRRRVV